MLGTRAPLPRRARQAFRHLLYQASRACVLERQLLAGLRRIELETHLVVDRGNHRDGVEFSLIFGLRKQGPPL
jgi:hypothetical protein